MFVANAMCFLSLDISLSCVLALVSPMSNDQSHLRKTQWLVATSLTPGYSLKIDLDSSHTLKVMTLLQTSIRKGSQRNRFVWALLWWVVELPRGINSKGYKIRCLQMSYFWFVSFASGIKRIRDKTFYFYIQLGPNPRTWQRTHIHGGTTP